MSETRAIDRLKIRSDPRRIREAREWLWSVVRASGWTREESQPLALVLSEACMNACRYGYEGRLNGIVELELEVDARQARLAVRDHGRGFDPATYVRPDLSVPREGGYGLLLMEQLSDRLEFEPVPVGTRVVMTMSRSRGMSGAGKGRGASDAG